MCDDLDYRVVGIQVEVREGTVTLDRTLFSFSQITKLKFSHRLPSVTFSPSIST